MPDRIIVNVEIGQSSGLVEGKDHLRIGGDHILQSRSLRVMQVDALMNAIVKHTSRFGLVEDATIHMAISLTADHASRLKVLGSKSLGFSRRRSRRRNRGRNSGGRNRRHSCSRVGRR